MRRRDRGGGVRGRRRVATPRVLAEVALVVVVIAVCVGAVRLAPADTALVVGLSVGAVALLRVLPEADSPRLPVLPAPERSGRRADVYRLSWGVTSNDDGVSPQVAGRLRTLVAERLAPVLPGADTSTDATGGAAGTAGAGGERDPHLAVLRATASGPLRTGRLTQNELRRTLTALEELDRLDQRTRGSR